MTDAELERQILDALFSVAPEAEGEHIDPGVSLRDQLDIDSMDFLNFLVALKDALGVEVPESDYAHVSTLGDCVKYLSDKLANG